MQKLQSWWKVLAFGVAAAAFGLMTASCTPTDDPDEKDGPFSVTLKNGGLYSFKGLVTGEDYDTTETEFYKGDTVAAFAGFKLDGTVFDKWTVTPSVKFLDDLNDGDIDGLTFFVMPAGNVTLTANWKTGPVTPDLYRVILNAGDYGLVENGEGYYAIGETVTITAGTRYGKRFAGWDPDRVELEDETSYTTSFTMPNYDVEISVIWADADPAKVRFSWELAEQGSLQSIAANTADVKDWYENVFLGPAYDFEDATDWPYFVGNQGVPENVYSRTLHGADGSPYKGEYFPTFEGTYSAVATVEDREIDDPDGEPHVYDIVANYVLDVEDDGKAFFEIAFDIGNFLDAGEDKGWFDDKFDDDSTPPRLEKKKAAKLLKKLKKGNVTYYVFKRAAKK